MNNLEVDSVFTISHEETVSMVTSFISANVVIKSVVLFINFFIRENSEISLHLDVEERQKSVTLATTQENNPTILLTSCEESSSSPSHNPGTGDYLKRRRSDSSLAKVETDNNVLALQKRNSFPSFSPSSGSLPEEKKRLCRIDVESSSDDLLESRSQESSPEDHPHGSVGSSQTEAILRPLSAPAKESSTSGGASLSSPNPTSSSGSKWSVALKNGKQAQTAPRKESSGKGNFLSGMAKTFHKWRTKTKRKRKFNYEKYIIYLESILPTVGFSLGGVIMTWNGIYTFIVIITFLVGVFAQEAFFGN